MGYFSNTLISLTFWICYRSHKANTWKIKQQQQYNPMTMKRSSIRNLKQQQHNPMTIKRSSIQNLKKKPFRSLQNESFSKTQRYRLVTLTQGSKLVNELRNELGVSSEWRIRFRQGTLTRCSKLVDELRNELELSSLLHERSSQAALTRHTSPRTEIWRSVN